MTTTERFRYVRHVSTEVVYDIGGDYVGDVWHDDDAAALIGRPAWNINNGTTYLWYLPTREAAAFAMFDVTLAAK